MGCNPSTRLRLAQGFAPRKEALFTGGSILGFLDSLGGNLRGPRGLSGVVVQGTNLGDAVREGIRYLVKSQSPEGRIGEPLTKHTYSQALAVHALAKAARSLSSGAGISEEEARSLKLALDWATACLVSAQNPGAGWRYGTRPGDNDSSVTATCLLALHAARRAGVHVPEHAFEGGLNWFQQVTDPKEQRVGYNARGTGKVFVPGKNEQYSDHPTMTAAAGVCQYHLVGSIWKPLVRMVFADLPKLSLNDQDYYYWHYGTRFAVLAFEPKEADVWKSAIIKAISTGQCLNETSCRRGAWESHDRWGCEGGRIYATALNTLTLEYALLPRAFEYGASPHNEGSSSAQTQLWIFKLKTGGKIQALSFKEQQDCYQVKVVGGSITILKNDVEQILKADSKGK